MHKAFDIDARILPYQNISMYEEISSNKYDYAEQIKVLREAPEVVIAPVKVFLEKFPEPKFFDENKIVVKKKKATALI